VNVERRTRKRSIAKAILFATRGGRKTEASLRCTSGLTTSFAGSAQGGERGRELRKEQTDVNTKVNVEERSHEVDAVMIVARRP
jgi:hypothetical protein